MHRADFDETSGMCLNVNQFKSRTGKYNSIKEKCMIKGDMGKASFARAQGKYLYLYEVKAPHC